MAIDFKLPVREKHSKKTVVIISTEGRKKDFPVMGYVGMETDLSHWDAEGKGIYSYINDIENVPHEIELWVVVMKNGDVETTTDKEMVASMSEHPEVLSFSKQIVTFPVGVRDDISEPILENIVKEFAPITPVVETTTAGTNGSMGGDLPEDFDK